MLTPQTFRSLANTSSRPSRKIPRESVPASTSGSPLFCIGRRVVSSSLREYQQRKGRQQQARLRKRHLASQTGASARRQRWRQNLKRSPHSFVLRCKRRTKSSKEMRAHLTLTIPCCSQMQSRPLQSQTQCHALWGMQSSLKLYSPHWTLL